MFKLCLIILGTNIGNILLYLNSDIASLILNSILNSIELNSMFPTQLKYL